MSTLAASVSVGACAAIAAAGFLVRLITHERGHHAAPRGRAAIVWEERTIPVKATRGRPPWEDLGPRNVRAALITPAEQAAARAYARWLVREADLRAEVIATRPWQDDTGTFTAIAQRWAT